MQCSVALVVGCFPPEVRGRGSKKLPISVVMIAMEIVEISINPCNHYNQLSDVHDDLGEGFPLGGRRGSKQVGKMPLHPTSTSS